jgi:DNA invertase Pin-like site-specific DNA recombinase
MQDALEDLAISDGYEWTLNSDERLLIRQSGNYSGWYQNGQIIIEQRDLGLSGTLGQEDRAGLEHLINLIEANQIETVYVLHISRLFRDQTLIDAFAFAELCKKHDVKIITPAMRLNLRISMHMDYYRREADWAAKELEVMHGRLYGAKKRKAHQGRWAGGYLPVGYILDERETIEGRSNPDWHKFMPYEPHARVVRLILRRLCLPGMTGGRVARWCAANGIRFEPFPPELAERYTKLVALRHPDTDGGWAVGECQLSGQVIRQLSARCTALS